ncbi:IS630 transposase-related protein [Thermosynechococcus vestitus]|uniref:IS630 transposase-related protein n=1 Tax=Thermosynechococcus vestitus TaxID=146786 RepID=UPI0013E8B26F
MCQWKLDWQALEPEVAARPADPLDDSLIDRVQQFGIQISTMSAALAWLGMTRKNRCVTKNALRKGNSRWM